MSNTNDKRRAVETREDWERVLTAAAHLQQIIPDAVLVGGSAAAIHVDHRFSYDDDHVVVNLKDRYDTVLRALENHAGWVTNRLKPPVMILGDLDGVETRNRNPKSHSTGTAPNGELRNARRHNNPADIV